MADLPISQLNPISGTISVNTMVAISVGGATYRMTIAQLMTVISREIDPVTGVNYSGNTLTVSFANSSNQTFTVTGGTSTSVPSLKIDSTNSKFLEELATISSIQDTDIIPIAAGAGELRKVTVGNLKANFNAGGGSSSGGSINTLREQNVVIYYSGTAPTVVKSAGNTIITVPADTVIISTEVQVVSPNDQNGTNTGYNVTFTFPSSTMQTLPYSGSISSAVIPDTSIHTLSTTSAQLDYVDSVVVAISNGIRVEFPETFNNVNGLRRGLGIRF